MGEYIKSLGEFALIDRISQIVKGSLKGSTTGIGDDCAVVTPTQFGPLFITTDSMIDGVHFDLKLCSMFDVGWKLLSVSLSDIAAVGGAPRWAVVTLGVSGEQSVVEVEEFYRGISTIAEKFGVEIVGGDTIATEKITVGLTLIGESVATTSLLRTGAKSGDKLYVSGEIGGGGAGLKACRLPLEKQGAAEFSAVRSKYLRPQPQIKLGQSLAKLGLSSCAIDISDGLLQDANHLVNRSNVDIELHLWQIPIMEGVADIGMRPIDAVVAGDDYELLFTSPFEEGELLEKLKPFSEEALPKLTNIGVVRNRQGETGELFVKTTPESKAESFKIALDSAGLSQRAGFNHF
mgnify:CR=1 FL=1